MNDETSKFINTNPNKPTVLVVDDSSENIELLSNMLHPLYKVKAALHGERALKIAKASPHPDMILLDIMMPNISGFEVYDLGIDVPVQTIVDKVKETGATVIGLSGFLTLAFDAMKETIDALSEAGLRDNLKIMIGGGQIDDEVKKYTGADAYGKDAMAAVTLSKEWLC